MAGSPPDASLLNLSAICHLRLGDAEQAKACWQQALRIKPDFAEASSNFGNFLKEQQNYQEAEAAYRQAIKIKPDYSEALYNLGILLQEQNRFEEAEATYRHVLRIKPDFAGALCNLGNTLQAQNRLQEAEAAYRQVRHLHPDYIDAHYNLAILLQGQKRLEEAEASFRQVLLLKPNHVDALYNLGVILQDQKRHEESRLVYQHLLHLDPQHADTHNNMGSLLRIQNRFEEAQASYRKALALNPNLVNACHMLAALENQKTSKAPEQYVAQLFNNYAENFEQHLVHDLQYNMHRFLRQAVEQLPDRPLCFQRAVDLGCGTGLVGQEFRSLTNHLLGIDIAQRMIDQAQKKGIYDELIPGEIEAVLERLAPGIDLFLAADVFIYIGELHALFQSIKEKSSPGAWFVFSVEHLEEGTFHLCPSGRYAHSFGYLQELAQTCQFRIVSFATKPIRTEGNTTITGGVYVLKCWDCNT